MPKSFTSRNTSAEPSVESFDIIVPSLAEGEDNKVETFHLNGFMPIYLIIEVDATSQAGRFAASRAYLSFFDHAIVAEDLDRWKRVVRDHGNGIDGPKLSEIYEWIYEVFVVRPTQNAESSSTGQGAAVTSKGGSSKRTSTGKR